jgi:predicted transcriptional regulator
MFSKLPKSGIVNKRMKDFYDALPTSFHRKEGIAIAEQMNIKVRTVDKYLTELVKKELISKEEYGTYCKRC